MSKDEVDEDIDSRKGSTFSTDDQKYIVHWMEGQGIGPSHDGVKRSEIEDAIGSELEYGVRTSLQHLVEINLVEEFRDTNLNVYVIAEWHDDVFIMGQVDEAASEGIEALIDHVQDEDPAPSEDASAVADGGISLRRVVAGVFDLKPAALEDFLRKGDQVTKLNDAVEGIESSDYETREDYGEIRFLNVPYRYRLTERAISLYEK